MEIPIRSCATLTVATALSACGGGSGPDARPPEPEAPPPEAGAIAAARSCLEQDGYLIKGAGDTRLVVSTRDGRQTAHIEAFTNLDGDPYLTGGLDDESVPLGPSALRAAVDECLAPWEANPPSSPGNLP